MTTSESREPETEPTSPEPQATPPAALDPAAPEPLLDQLRGIPLGHYYSPYPSTEDIERAQRTWDSPPATLPGIDLNVGVQLELLETLGALQADIDFPVEDRPDWRYRYDNPFFGYGDSDILSAVLRYLEPRRVIEIGSGFSSALMLDVNERFFANSIAFTFIDPEPERLLGVLRPGDVSQATVITGLVQDVPLETYEALGNRDILFIDSTHVVKAGSDVNHLCFEVLPRLRPGVWIHIHDIFWPFEYSRDWVEGEGRAWSEAYMLRAFLEYNEEFSIRFFSDYLCRMHETAVRGLFPAMLAGKPGGLWLRREGLSSAACRV